MLASMSTTEWNDVGVNELPTGTVTLLLADVEGSTRLWETRPDEMTAALARLDQVVSEAVAAHDGVRPVEQGEGDSFVIAFGRASDALACALDLQRAPLAPIRLRIGMHTGEVRLRDEGNYVGPTINRTARLRDLAHGGQTVLSGTTESLVVDQLPGGATLIDLGSHPLRDLPRPERVVQLCHPGLQNDFPPLRTAGTVVAHNLPAQLTSFVGRQSEMSSLRDALAANRLVTLTGTGGVGKTRLATQVAEAVAREFAAGVWYVDLAPITVPEVVALTVSRALGLPDQPGRSTMDTLLRFVRDRQMLVVLDNCEHLLDASAEVVTALLGGASNLKVLATSREPLLVAGEATWQVPSLSVGDEAVELFTDRARLAQADFTMTDDTVATVTEICRRLDGMPLAIELAAARVRALSLTDIVDSLHDRFRLLTGGSRTAVRRQQTLRASVDWSHALLTDTERILFRRLAVFLGGFDLDAARAVAGADGVERYQVLDQLSLIVDKSLVVAEKTSGSTRYRLLETVRQYAQEKLGESGEADAMRSRHRDYYTSMAAVLDAPARSDYEQRVEQAEIEMDNLRSAFGWSMENADTEQALALASSLQPLWTSRGRLREGRAWFDTVFADARSDIAKVAAAVRVRALVDKALLDCWSGTTASLDQAEEAVAMAREVDDPALLARALAAYSWSTGYGHGPEVAQPFFAEAIDLTRTLGDSWRLSQILSYQAFVAIVGGDPVAARAAAEEGCALTDAIGDRVYSRQCHQALAFALLMQGALTDAVAEFSALSAAAEAANEDLFKPGTFQGLGLALSYQGQVVAARTAAQAGIQAAADLGEFLPGMGYTALANAELAAGDVAAAYEASETARRCLSHQPYAATSHTAHVLTKVALAMGDSDAARRYADEAIAATKGWHLAVALTTRARVSIAEGRREDAERDAYDALATAATGQIYVTLPDIFEVIAALRADAGSHQHAARILGAAKALRDRMGAVRFKIYDADHDACVRLLREAMGESEFDAAWSEGATLSTEDAITYTQRGRGERNRPASGWASLTPAENDVVRLVCEGLGNKDIATRLFVSPRTVQAHLTHVYTKLGIASRVQLVQEAARQSG
ncbi:transcriptional regulator [Mycobacterium sp. 852002-51163_SCH5372311]|nr:transcriptional regulator [Mycobacterium sp. 852002-51163_SCH5372311]